MIESAFRILLQVAAAYALAGVATAVWFFARHIKRLEPSAAEGSRGFRFLIAPGVIALWPVILMKVRSTELDAPCEGAEQLRRAHRLAFILLAVFGILLFTTALVWRAPAFLDLPATEIPAP